MSKELGAYIEAVTQEVGEPTDLMAAFRLVQVAEARLVEDRQRAYGAGNISKFGLHGVAIRASDKVERAATLVFNGRDDAGETIEDTLGDLANYGTIGVLLSRGWWGLPMIEPADGETA